MIYTFCAFLNGDIEDAMRSIKKFVCSKSALYLILIWIRVLKFVFENPIEVNKRMVNVPFFNEFQKSPTCQPYIDGLVRNMAGLSVSAPSDTPTVKRSWWI